LSEHETLSGSVNRLRTDLRDLYADILNRHATVDGVRKVWVTANDVYGRLESLRIDLLAKEKDRRGEALIASINQVKPGLQAVRQRLNTLILTLRKSAPGSSVSENRHGEAERAIEEVGPQLAALSTVLPETLALRQSTERRRPITVRLGNNGLDALKGREAS
jgi:hypothetical protein